MRRGDIWSFLLQEERRRLKNKELFKQRVEVKEEKSRVSGEPHRSKHHKENKKKKTKKERIGKG